MNVRTTLEGHLDKLLLLGQGNVRRKRKFPQGLGGGGRLRDPDLVSQVGQGRDIVLLSGLDELPRRPALNPCQNDISRGNLVGFDPPFERLQ